MVKFKSLIGWRDGNLEPRMIEEGMPKLLIEGKEYEASPELLNAMLRSGLQVVVIQGVYVDGQEVKNAN